MEFHKFSSLCLGALVVILSGCQTAPRVTTPMRAIWVTRYEYKTPEDVTRIMADCQQGGFNAVLFQVRGNGTAFYQSKLEPWAEELGGTDPGWDPLAVACQEAHDRGLELHAWVNVMPGWHGTEPPEDPEQLYNKHPDWFWYDQHGDRQALSSFYVSLNPCLPEVRQYLVDVYHDLIARYDVDGLHMDYIRFPNEPPAIPQGSGIDYPHDERTLALYKHETGLTPDENKERWSQWRTEQVTKLVRQIRDMVHQTKADVVLTAAVGTNPKSSLAHFRDDRRWAREKLVDAVLPMNYVDDPAEFGKRIDGWLADKPPVPVIPGLWFGRHRGMSPEEATEAVRQEIEMAAAKTGNFCVFSYGSLFNTPERAERGGRAERAEAASSQPESAPRPIREVRREILLPYIQELAQGGG